MITNNTVCPKNHLGTHVYITFVPFNYHIEPWQKNIYAPLSKPPTNILPNYKLNPLIACQTNYHTNLLTKPTNIHSKGIQSNTKQYYRPPKTKKTSLNKETLGSLLEPDLCVRPHYQTLIFSFIDTNFCPLPP